MLVLYFTGKLEKSIVSRGSRAGTTWRASATTRAGVTNPLSIPSLVTAASPPPVAAAPSLPPVELGLGNSLGTGYLNEGPCWFAPTFFSPSN